MYSASLNLRPEIIRRHNRNAKAVLELYEYHCFLNALTLFTVSVSSAI